MGSGKGDTYRPVDPKKWEAGWMRAYAICDHDCPLSNKCKRYRDSGPYGSGKQGSGLIITDTVGKDCKWFSKRS